MQKHKIGVDTGGTYTDAVLLDRHSSAIIATAKKPATHYDLSVATSDALHVLGKIDTDNRDLAIEGAEILGAACTMEPQQFARTPSHVSSYLRLLKTLKPLSFSQNIVKLVMPLVLQ